MDRTKRQTLKRIAGVTVAGTGFCIANNTLASSAIGLGSRHTDDKDTDASLSSINVHSRLSASTNDIEVVITNIGDQAARITQLTPSQTNTQRGVFHFSKLLDEGELVLAAGQSTTVPMTPHSGVVDIATQAAQHARSLSAALRSSFSVITDNSAFARVNVMDGIKLA